MNIWLGLGVIRAGIRGRWGSFAFRNSKMSKALNFTRASTASDTLGGVITNYAIDIPRMNRTNGILLEDQRTNNLLWSEDVTNAVWGVSSMGISGTTTISPDGVSLMRKIIPSAALSSHLIFQNSNVVSGSQYTLSLYVKSAGYNYIQIAGSTGFNTTDLWVNFDLSAGVASGNGAGAAAGTYGVENIGSGIYRVWVSASCTSSNAAGRLLISPLDANTLSRLPSYTADGTSGVFIWGAQFGVGNTPSTYIKTTTTTMTRAADFLKAKNSYRTNPVLNSEDLSNATWTKDLCSVVANQSSAPDGTYGMDLIISDSSAGNHRCKRTAGITLIAGQIYTASAYIKAYSSPYNYQLLFWNVAGNAGVIVNPLDGSVVGTSGNEYVSSSVTNVGFGIYRVSVTLATVSGGSYQFMNYLASGTAVSFPGDGVSGVYVWGCQVDDGASAREYIPTSGSAATQGDLLTKFPYKNGAVVIDANTPIGAISGSDIAYLSLISKNTSVTVRDINATGKIDVSSSGFARPVSMTSAAAISYNSNFKVAITWKEDVSVTKRVLCSNNLRLAHFRNSTTETYQHCTSQHKVPLNADYSNIKLHYENIYADFTGETVCTATGTLKASIQVGGTITPADATVTVAAGGSYTFSFTGLSLPAGTEFYVHTRLAMPGGSKTVPRSALSMMPTMDVGCLLESSGTLDVTTTGIPYGAIATATVSGGNITALNLGAGGAGYTNATSEVYAWEVQSDGVTAYKLVGTATNTAGAVASLSLTDGTPPTGVSAWVSPTLAITHGGFQTEATRTVRGWTPNAITGTPSVPVRALWLLGDSITLGSQTAGLTDQYGNNSNFEFAVNNRVAIGNGGLAGLNVFNLFEVSKTFTKTLNLYAEFSTDCLICLGINDIAWSKTASTTIDNLKSLRSVVAAKGLKVNFATIGPRTNTTDNYATTDNQSLVTINGIYYPDYQNQINAAITSGALQSDQAYVDFNSVINYNTNYFAITPNAVTNDGLHPTDSWTSTPKRSGVSRSKLNSSFVSAFDFLTDTTRWKMSVDGHTVIKDTSSNGFSSPFTDIYIGSDGVNDQPFSRFNSVKFFSSFLSDSALKSLALNESIIFSYPEIPTANQIKNAVSSWTSTGAPTSNFANMGATINVLANKWTGSILSPDNGKIYGIPFAAQTVLIIDPAAGTATTSTMGATFSSTSAYNGGCLGANGRIYGVPNTVATILEIDPVGNTAVQSTFGATLVTNEFSWSGAVLARNGKIYGIPFFATDCLIIDTNTTTATATRSTLGGGVVLGSGKWNNGCLGPNDKIYGCPSSASNPILVIDTITNTASTITPPTLSGSYQGCIMGPDKKIYFVPKSATQVLIYDPATNTFTQTNYGLDLSLQWTDAKIGPDGYIWMSPRSATGYLVINTSAQTATIETVGQTFITTEPKFNSCCLGHNGHLYSIPYGTNTVKICDVTISGTGTANATTFNAVVDSAFINRS